MPIGGCLIYTIFFNEYLHPITPVTQRSQQETFTKNAYSCRVNPLFDFQRAGSRRFERTLPRHSTLPSRAPFQTLRDYTTRHTRDCQDLARSSKLVIE